MFSRSYTLYKGHKINSRFTKFLPKIREREFPKFPHCDSVTNITETNFHRKIFREINTLVTSLVTFTKFSSKRVRINFRHSRAQCGNCGNFVSLTHFWQNFRESNYLLNISYKIADLKTYFFGERELLVFSTLCRAHWEKLKIYRKKFVKSTI